MGFYDRDYQRGGSYDERQPGFHLGGPTTLTTKLVIGIFGVYLIQLFTQPSEPISPNDHGWFTNTFRLYADWWQRPWTLYQLLTYGFLHDPTDLKHVVFNMLGFWIFGREVEARYGAREFLIFFLAALVIAGLAWTLAEIPSGQSGVVLGASGGVAAVVILFALNFPYRTVMLMLLFPMPMWVAAVIFVIIDLIGAIGRFGNTAFTAHLGGAAFGYLYYRNRWRLERFVPRQISLPRFRRKPKLRVLRPDAHDEPSTDDVVDQILKKIQDQGKDSLTRHERRILEEASREYQRRRK
jgi:membrane associated rhomboid family serine protease